VDLRIGGPACSFPSSYQNGIQTMGFDSWFPVTLDLRPSSGASFCRWDGWWALMLVNVVLLCGLTLLRPSRQLWFWSMIISLYWYVALGSTENHVDATGLLTRGGSCGLLVLCCQLLLWDVGGAKHFLPDFEAGAPFDGLLEILCALPLLHQHLVKYITGDHGLDAETFSGTAGPLFFGVVALICLPIVVWMLRRWWYSGVLRQLSCAFAAVALAVVLLSVLFATSDFSFHLHHYFLGLLGCLFFRGNSRIAAMMRAIFLGSFLNGIAIWGYADNLPIWSHIPADGKGLTPWRESSLPNYTAFAPPEGGPPAWTQFTGSDSNMTLTISWTHASSLNLNLPRWDWCERLEGERSMSAYGPGRVWVLEMNNIEIYRGRSHSMSFNISALTSPCGPGRYYFMVGTVDPGPWAIPHPAMQRATLDTRQGLPDVDGVANFCRKPAAAERNGPGWNNSGQANLSEQLQNISNESLLNASSDGNNSSVLNASS